MGTTARTKPPTIGYVDFSLRQDVSGPAGLITVTGELDMETAPRLRGALLTVLDAGARDLVVDLREVTFLDSTALGVLVFGLKRAREAQGDLGLVATSSQILRMLAITRLDTVFHVYPDPASARASS
jgi:anti-sigma B factor antagonist